MESSNGETEFFGTETMAEVCARQGRLAEAIAIYRRLLETRPDDERCSQWTHRYQSLQRAIGFRGEGGGKQAPAATPRPVAAATPAATPPTGPAQRSTPPPLLSRSTPAPSLLTTPPPLTRPIEKTPIVHVQPGAWEALAQVAQVHRMPLLITQPVRSGQVIRAEKNDLIVLGPVNPGAQLVADGNIHVYGPLRGQAIAGAMGCAQARIFCQKLDAELVAINGIYLIHEDIPPGFIGGPAQVFLQDDRCLVERL